MSINTSSIWASLSEIERDVRRAADAVNPWTAPDGLCAGLESAAQAVLALREVHDTIADLEPAAAQAVTDALQRGLVGPR